MKILQVFNEYLFRGGEEIWVDKLPVLLAPEVRVEDLRFRSSEWLGPGAPPKWQQCLWIRDNPASRQALREAVERVNPDLLLYHNLIPVASLGLYDEARRLGLPVVQYIHNFRPFSADGMLWVNGRVNDAALHGNPWPEIFAGSWNGSKVKTAILSAQLARLRRSGDLDAVRLWIAISEFMRDCFLKVGKPKDKIFTLPHCWESDPEAGSSPAPEQGHYLFLGRLESCKGVDVALSAWRRLERDLGEQCPQLIFAGKGPMEADLIDAAQDSDRVEYAGFVDGKRKSELIAGSRAVLVPSVWWEPLGLVVHEAYSHARPVLAAKSGGLCETVRHRETGMLHAPGSAEELAASVFRMEELGAKGRSRMGQEGKRWLETEASVPVWKRKFLEMLRAV